MSNPETAAIRAATLAAAERLGLTDEILERAAVAAAKRSGVQMPGDPTIPAGDPLYVSWGDYLEKTTPAQRRTYCAKKAVRANAPRYLSGPADVRVTADDIWSVIERRQGRCFYCGSLALEPAPLDPVTKHLSKWAQVGRRIGSLAHVEARILGGSNAVSNLDWACFWCNTWPDERRPGALDHGGIQADSRFD